MFSFLIERGADPNRVNPKLVNFNKHTAKDLAEKSGYESMVTYLSGQEVEADAKVGWKQKPAKK